jgi:hypothetical protein
MDNIIDLSMFVLSFIFTYKIIKKEEKETVPNLYNMD